MASLILHVGPGKCGSSSIQDFFKSQKRPCIEKTRFEMLDPAEISKLNQEVVDEIELVAFFKFLSKKLKRCDVLILSHEYLFDCPDTIKNICNIAKKLVSSITIIGYSRKQSGLIISIYSQWLFRSHHRAKETIDILIDLELDPILFSGIERHLIASIANDFYSARQLSDKSILDWHKSYQNLRQLVQESGALVKCGVLPDKESNKSLIQDFCEKSDISLHKKMKVASYKTTNISFNNHLVEAINNAVTLGLRVPDPHECNKEFEIISTKMSSGGNTNSDFLSNLKSYIDTYYLSSNAKLCDKYGFNKKYFSPSKLLNKQQILDIIKQEGENRTKDSSIVINNLRMLSANMAITSLKITKDTQSK